jgi:hypothetical protein
MWDWFRGVSLMNSRRVKGENSGAPARATRSSRGPQGAEYRCGRRAWLRITASWWGVVALVGCGPSARIADGTDPWASSVGQFARLVERYRVANRGQLPENEQALRGFAESLDAENLRSLGIDRIEECFVSDRDGQPLAARLGPADKTGGDPSVVCYERDGRDGVRLVGKFGGDVEVADEARFAELVPAP